MQDVKLTYQKLLTILEEDKLNFDFQYHNH